MKPVGQPQIIETTGAPLPARAPYWQYVPRRGLSIPSITVLDPAGNVIEDQQRRVLRHLAQNGLGADIIFGVGTTGEWNRLANRERQRLICIQSDEIDRLNTDFRKHQRQPAPKPWRISNVRSTPAPMPPSSRRSRLAT
jgi:hypothetical protein